MVVKQISQLKVSHTHTHAERPTNKMNKHILRDRKSKDMRATVMIARGTKVASSSWTDWLWSASCKSMYLAWLATQRVAKRETLLLVHPVPCALFLYDLHSLFAVEDVARAFRRCCLEDRTIELTTHNVNSAAMLLKGGDGVLTRQTWPRCLVRVRKGLRQPHPLVSATSCAVSPACPPVPLPDLLASASEWRAQAPQRLRRLWCCAGLQITRRSLERLHQILGKRSPSCDPLSEKFASI